MMWANVGKQMDWLLAVKIDFAKAFNRIKHSHSHPQQDGSTLLAPKDSGFLIEKPFIFYVQSSLLKQDDDTSNLI